MSFPAEIVWLNGAPGSGKVSCSGLGGGVCRERGVTVFLRWYVLLA